MTTEYFMPKAFLEFTRLINPQNHLDIDAEKNYLDILSEAFTCLPCGGKSFKHYLLELNKRELRRFMEPKERTSLSKSNVQMLRKALAENIDILNQMVENIDRLRKSRMVNLSADSIKNLVDSNRYTLPDHFSAQWQLATEHRLKNGIKMLLLLLASLFQKYYEEDHKNELSISEIVDHYLQIKIEEGTTINQPVLQPFPVLKPFSALKKYAEIIQEHYGRQTQLKSIYEILHTRKLCVITGKPGFGKSSLALKYSFNAMQEAVYDSIIFLACENIESLKRSLGISDIKNIDIEEALDSYLDAYMKPEEDRILFVFDNLGKDRYLVNPVQASQSPDHLKDILVRLIKRKYKKDMNKHVLITSIHEDLFYETSFDGCQISIEEFTMEEARNYLTNDTNFHYEATEIDHVLSEFSRIPIILKSVKILARKQKSFRNICPDYVHKNDDLYYLLKLMLSTADSVYASALKCISFCYKEDIPSSFIASCVRYILSPISQSQNIEEEIRKENEAYHILDINQNNDEYYYSIHQTYQAEIRRLWSESGIEVIEAIYHAYEDTMNFYSYYGINDYRFIRLIKPHIEAFWTLLDDNKKNEYKELWIHYRWIDEYFLSSGSEYVVSPFEEDRGFSLRFECDRLSNGLEDGDFNRVELSDFTAYLSEKESVATITSNLMVRSRVCIFFMELIAAQETDCIQNTFSEQSLINYVLETLTLIDNKIQTERNKKMIVFYAEHACMLRSMLSIDARSKRTYESHHQAVLLNEQVLNLLHTLTSGKHAKLSSSYDSGFLYHFALNLHTVPQWENPSDFLLKDTDTVVNVLEHALEETQKCNAFYIEEHFFERAETELGNLFDICGKLAKAYKGKDNTKCSYYVQKSKAYLQERYEIRKRTLYLPPEFMHSYYFKRYIFYTQYALADPSIDTHVKKQELLRKAEKIVSEWSDLEAKLSNYNLSTFYRMKGVLYRKMLDMNCAGSDSERLHYLHIAEDCFALAIQKVPDNNSIYIINTIEKAIALKSFGEPQKAWEILQAIKELVETTGAWNTVYRTAVKYTEKQITELKNYSE